ncbi:MAG: hypothetical protein RIB84_19755 [Sneathiellaceae bacterium]
MHRSTGLRVIGGFALAAAVTLPWPDGGLLAALGGPNGQSETFSPGLGPGLSLLLAIGATILLLTVLLSGRAGRAPVARPRAPAVQARRSEPALRRVMLGHHQRERRAWYLLGHVVDHVSDLNLRAEAGQAAAGPAGQPLPQRARALLAFVAQPADTLVRPSPDFRRQTRDLLHQLRD